MNDQPSLPDPTSPTIPPMIGPLDVREGDLDAPYWEALAQRRLRLQRCEPCDRWIWAPQWRCEGCGSWEPTWADAEGRGTVHSWIRTWHRVAPEVGDALPYISVLVDLDAGVRVLGVWTGTTEPVLGAATRLVWHDGAPGTCWEPA